MHSIVSIAQHCTHPIALPFFNPNSPLSSTALRSDSLRTNFIAELWTIDNCRIIGLPGIKNVNGIPAFLLSNIPYSLKITRSYFSTNVNGGRGAAIRAVTSTYAVFSIIGGLEIDSCTFEDNTATLGGALAFTNTFARILNSKFLRNKAIRNGGHEHQ